MKREEAIEIVKRLLEQSKDGFWAVIDSERTALDIVLQTLRDYEQLEAATTTSHSRVFGQRYELYYLNRNGCTVIDLDTGEYITTKDGERRHESRLDAFKSIKQADKGSEK